ncbi:RNA pseudouridine synthase [Sporosarcina ureilytica]|uniref:Pseudouridine synthase n=2 Tax=Sporosarcina ureilytica TaxID=298596 RepID=A0A1D8JIJ3_9BACL|nr:RNA pseudouridine synthase [Sporosarcina ureilytica]
MVNRTDSYLVDERKYIMKRKARSRELDGDWIVEESSELLEFLYEKHPNRSRNAVKGVLSRGQVVVNGKVSTQFNDTLHPGDTVQIHARVATETVKLSGIRILFEDDDIIVIEKEAGLLTVASKNERHVTAYRQLMDYVKTVHPNNRIFIVHRLDRDTSGVMIFAKSKDIQQTLQDNWHDIVPERAYVALVEGRVKKDGTITSWLKENRAFIVYSSDRPNDGQKAVTHYKVLKTSRQNSLLEVHLETGRKNQIRVHMQDIGNPIVGDKKYGARTRPIGRLGLHAHKISFTHPTTGEFLTFESKVPASFLKGF